MANTTTDYDIIFNRKHPQIAERENIWQLIYDSYRGGINYLAGDYLFAHAKEGDASFAQRKKRAVYFNQIQPLADLLSGFLFMKPPSRKNTENSNWLHTQADNNHKSLDEFMKVVSVHSLLFTCGVLVDSPSFDLEEAPTMKDRMEKELNPYCVMYLPFSIIDFNIGSDGKLDWVILDNTYYDNDDPFVEGVEREIRRLWTRETYQDFELLKEGQGESIIAGEIVTHNLGIVPFRFINWKDDNSDFIGESVFEDPAMISQLIYNKLSEMDEMIASGSFKALMYPTADGKVPAALLAGGVGALSIIPYQGEYDAPTFEGAKLEDVEPFLKAMEFYLSEILKKIGMDTDETKDYVKSGLSKKIDFQKVRTLLTTGSISLSRFEEWIFDTAAKWTGKESNAEVHYTTHYADEDIQIKVDLLNELLVHPFKKLRTTVTSLLVKNLLTGEIPQSELDEIYAEIKEGANMEQLALLDAQDLSVLERDNNTINQQESEE